MFEEERRNDREVWEHSSRETGLRKKERTDDLVIHASSDLHWRSPSIQPAQPNRGCAAPPGFPCCLRKSFVSSRGSSQQSPATKTTFLVM